MTAAPFHRGRHRRQVPVLITIAAVVGRWMQYARQPARPARLLLESSFCPRPHGDEMVSKRPDMIHRQLSY